MARTRKVTQTLNLQKYDVLIDDRGPRSDYFKITQFDGYFYGGRNAFLIAGTTTLKPNSKLLVEILNVNGDTVYSVPVANFVEGSSRLIQVEVYSDTPIGPGKIIVLGSTETYLDGSPIPSVWQDKYNVRWITDVIISPLINNKSPIRFINPPALTVEEKFYPSSTTASFSQSIDLERSAYDLSAIRYNIFQNGYLIKLQNPTDTNVFKSEYINGKLVLSASISGSSEVLNAELPITKIYNSTTAESRGLLITSSLKTRISDAYISSSIANYSSSWSPLGNIIAQSSSINVRYNKIVESAETGSRISFVELRIANLNTLSGEIHKVRVGYKVSTDPGEYIVLGDVLTQVTELLSTDSGSKIVQLGKFNTIKIDEYWYAATMSVVKDEVTPILPNYYASSSFSTNLQITQSSDILLDGIRTTPPILNNEFIDGVSYFIGTTNSNQFELFPNSEYTLKFDAFAAKASSSIELIQADYVLEVYLIQPETSTARLLETNTRGQLLGSLKLSSTSGVQIFEAQEFNFRPKINAPGAFGLRFIIYGGFWHIANVSLKVAEERLFSPDEVTLLVPNVNFSNKLLTFKTEYLDINNNSTTVSTISTPVYFTGSGFNLLSGASASYATTASNILGGTTNYLPLWKSATELSSSAIYQNSGNIGIGKTDPTAKLDVQGNVNITGSLTISGSSTFTNIGPALFSGSVATATTTLTGNATLNTTNSVVLCNASAGTQVITLPTAVGITGRKYTIKRITTNSSVIVNVVTTSSQYIDGELSYSLVAQNSWVTLVSDGTNWTIVDSYDEPVRNNVLFSYSVDDDPADAVFTRTSTATYVDQNGIIRTAQPGELRNRHYIIPNSGGYQQRTLLLEPQRTNLIVRSEELNDAAWAKSAGVTITPNAITAPDGTLTGDLLTDDGSDAFNQCAATPVYTGDGEKCFALYLKAGTAVTTDISMFDVTALTHRHRVRVTWTAGVPTLSTSVGTGTLYPVEFVRDGWYRILFSGTGNVAANSNRFIIYVTGTFAAVAGTVYVWGAQAEDAAVPSSYIPTAATTVTRNADSLYFPFTAPPQAMTVYVRTINRGQYGGPIGMFRGVVSVGGSATGAGSRLRLLGSGAGLVSVNYDNGTASVEGNAGAGPPLVLGDTYEHRGVLFADGSARSSFARNAGTEQLGSQTAAPAGGINPAWVQGRIYLNEINAAVNSPAAFTHVLVTAGEQTMGTMRKTRNITTQPITNISVADKIIHNGDIDTAIRFPAADTFTIETAGVERLRVDSTGNVGIGITNPGTKLHVQGAISASSYTSSLNNQVGFFGTASRAVSASWAPSTGGTVTSIVAGSGLNGGTITSTGTISVNSGSMLPYYSSSIFSRVSGDITINSATGVATIAANSVALGTDTTGNYVGQLTQGRGITITGGTGEGTDNTIRLGSASAAYNISGSGQWFTVAERVGVNGRGISEVYVYSGGGDLSPQFIKLLWNMDWGGTAQIRVVGNSGIGVLPISNIRATYDTTTQTAQLEVQSSTNSNATIFSNVIDYSTAGNATTPIIKPSSNFTVLTQIPNAYFYDGVIFTSGSTAGFVGIGTTSPGAKLHVQGNVSASAYTSSLSNQVGFFGTASIAQTSSLALNVNYDNITNRPTLVSASSQVSYTGLSNIPAGILSSSTQINNLSNVSASFATSASRAQTSSLTLSSSIANRTTNESGHLTFIGATATGNQPIYSNTNVRVNPSTGGITATSFTGSLFGTASRAISASHAPFTPQFTDVSITPTRDSPYEVGTTDVNKRLVMNTTTGDPIINLLSTNTSGIPTNSVIKIAAFGTYVGLQASFDLNVLDTQFNPNSSGLLTTIVTQSDGKIVIGGQFNAVSDTIRVNIARLDADGTLDTGFNPGANNLMSALAIQSDGKIVIGGAFTSASGDVRNRIARLNTDGTLDTGFNPNADGIVRALAIQSDGKIVMAGEFFNVSGTVRNRIARLNTDGTLDTGFDPNANGNIRAVAIQSDGKIVIGGEFNAIGGSTRNRIARLNTDGTLDTFNPNANSALLTVAIQSDGKIIAGGQFTTMGGSTRNRIARLNTDGTLDTGFDPNANSTAVNTVTMQSDGKIIVGGDFTTIGGGARNRLARLNSDGTLDTSLNQNASATVRASVIQSDGKIIVGGDFTTINSTTRNRIARIGGYVSLSSGADILRAPYTLTLHKPRYTVITLEKIAAGEWVITESNIPQ